MNPFSMKWIRMKVENSEFLLSHHAHQERQAENIEISEIRCAFANGKILEDYPDDQRGASCLVVGYTPHRPKISERVIDGKVGFNVLEDFYLCQETPKTQYNLILFFLMGFLVVFWCKNYILEATRKTTVFLTLS